MALGFHDSEVFSTKAQFVATFELSSHVSHRPKKNPEDLERMVRSIPILGTSFSMVSTT